MNEELQWRITTFFKYWKERHEFICDLNLDRHRHEANVLLWGHIDALSNLWAKNIGREQCGKRGKRIIFDAFLARYGGESFQIISLPDIWNRVDRGDVWVNQKKQLKLSGDVCEFLKTIGGRRDPTPTEERLFRQSRDDLSLDAIITATLAKYPDTNRIELEEWLTLSRYGAIAYKEFRSSYIHEGRLGEGGHGFNLGWSATRPTYISHIYTTPPTIGFSVEFMLCVLRCCIDAFEADALALQTDPVPA